MHEGATRTVFLISSTQIDPKGFQAYSNPFWDASQNL
jgi:hypothetical protein